MQVCVKGEQIYPVFGCNILVFLSIGVNVACFVLRISDSWVTLMQLC
jgi:hypothetical protein